MGGGGGGDGGIIEKNSLVNIEAPMLVVMPCLLVEGGNLGEGRTDVSFVPSVSFS